MNQFKRNFSAFQNESKQSNVSTGSKKVKLTSEPNIKVYTRFRPISKEDYADTYQVDSLDNSITINKSEDEIRKNGGIKKFFFSEVFEPETTQEDITKRVCIPLLEDLFNNGKSALLFTYGVTNAGKTHTIIGPAQDPGILPRSIELILNYCNQIFDTMIKDSISLETTENSNGLKMENILTLQNHPEYALKDIKIFLESFEIYNEDIYDLLAESKKDKISGNLIRPKLQMKEGDNKKVYVKDLTSVEIGSSAQAKAILEKCLANRSQADTALNSNSSRSHTIFRIALKSTYQSSANKCSTESSLCIVDLAGSERAKRTDNSGNQMIEACNINKSLLVLGRCLKSLKDNQGTPIQSSVVPYRDSKLTRILYEYFHEENNLRMIANINPRQVDFEESMRVLNYAAIAKDIQPIKSRIDNTRKIFFPSASIKDIQRMRTDDGMSAISTEDSLLNFKNLFEDKENINSNSGRDSLARKPFGFNQRGQDEKDIKIKVLEDMVLKLQDKLHSKDVTHRLSNLNDSFKESMRSLVNDMNPATRPLDSFLLDTTNLSTTHDYGLMNLQNSFSDIQNLFSHDVKPLNVNYFIFQGPVEDKGLNGLQKAFNINESNLHKKHSNVNKIWSDPAELVRGEKLGSSEVLRTSIVEQINHVDYDHMQVKEEAIESESVHDHKEDVIIINDFEEPKPEPKERKKRGGKGKKANKKAEHLEVPNLAELTGYEHLTTPEIIKLTMELDEKENTMIPESDEIQQLDPEAYNEAIKATPVARRTRGKRTKN